jgi:hypothetical protein
MSGSKVAIMAGNRRIRWLVVAHLTFGLLSGVLAPIEVHIPFGTEPLPPQYRTEHILVVPVCVLCLGQAFLLAFWAVTAASSPWLRVGGLLAGTVYLEVLLAFGLQAELLGCVTVTAVVTSAALIVLRMKGFRLVRGGDGLQSAGTEAGGMRFSIRGLMLFTAAVALLSAGVRYLRAVRSGILVFTCAWGLCFVVVGLLALWAVLGIARPMRRLVSVFAASLALGVLFIIATLAAGWTYVMLIMLLYPLILFASLRVIRSCGNRFARRAVELPGRRSGEGRAGGSSQISSTTGEIEPPG